MGLDEGWYQHVDHPGMERYWDGAAWTAHLRPIRGGSSASTSTGWPTPDAPAPETPRAGGAPKSIPTSDLTSERGKPLTDAERSELNQWSKPAERGWYLDPLDAEGAGARVARQWTGEHWTGRVATIRESAMSPTPLVRRTSPSDGHATQSGGDGEARRLEPIEAADLGPERVEILNDRQKELLARSPGPQGRGVWARDPILRTGSLPIARYWNGVQWTGRLAPITAPGFVDVPLHHETLSQTVAPDDGTRTYWARYRSRWLWTVLAFGVVFTSLYVLSGRFAARTDSQLLGSLMNVVGASLIDGSLIALLVAIPKSIRRPTG